MEKIIAALGLDPKATEDDAVKAIESLKASVPKKEPRAALIQKKMAAGLRRETAIEAIENQEREDALQAEREARTKSKKKGDAAE